MTGIYYVEVADLLSDAGLAVGVGDQNRGWETRARSSGGFPAAPLATFWHHTASQTSIENDLSWQCHGCDDAPVGNMTIARDGTVWPVAAGASNCAGKGGPATFSRGTIPADSGNTRGWNIEVANNGVGERWPIAQINSYFVASNTLNAHFGNQPTDVISHAWGAADCPGWTTRKIDPATSNVEGPWQPSSVNSSGTWSLADIRAECAARAGTISQEDPDMTDDQATQLAELHALLTSNQAGFPDPGGAGGNLNAGWAALWGEELIRSNVLGALGDIQRRLDGIEARL